MNPDERALNDYLQPLDPPEHRKFSKIPRFNREIIITEKIDGTNGLIYIDVYGRVYAGSHKQWVTSQHDNFGFASWVRDHADELRKLGPGYHYGEWYGRGIQRNYDLDHRRFALFNVGRWHDDRNPMALCIKDDKRQQVPACCGVVPTLARIEVPSTAFLANILTNLRVVGSHAVPGYMNPEGIVIFHTAASQLFKITLENDDKPKGTQDERKRRQVQKSRPGSVR